MMAVNATGREGGDGLTVAAVTQAAQVSTGTFYNYFDSIDGLLVAVADELGQVFELGADNLARLSGDPAARVCLGILQLLALPTADPVYARAFLTVMVARPSFRTKVRMLVEGEVRAGVGTGVFNVSSESVASDALLGAVMQTMRSQLLGEAPTGAPDLHRAAVLEVCLRLVGVAPSDIDAIRQRAMQADTVAV